MVICKLGEPLLKAIGRKASVIRVAGTRLARKIAFGGPFETLCATAYLDLWRS
jgi:hypothetical protein